MLPPNSPNTKYLAGGSALLTVTFIPGVLAGGTVSIGALFLCIIGVAGFFYFLGRTMTNEIVTHRWSKTVLSLLICSIGVMMWSYARFVFEINFTGSRLGGAILVTSGVLFFIGLAQISWYTGRLSESVAIKQTRVGSNRTPE